MSVSVRCIVLPGMTPPTIKFTRGLRELKDDSRTTVNFTDTTGAITIKKCKYTDEAKYSAILEIDGREIDKITWSVFVKGNRQFFLEVVLFINLLVVQDCVDNFVCVVFRYSAITAFCAEQWAYSVLQYPYRVSSLIKANPVVKH